MKKLYYLVLKSYVGPLVMTFFIALFILVMQFVWKYVDDLVGKGLEWYVVAQLLFYASSSFVPLALPLAILISSLMTLGNLGEHYELVAMKSAGISLRSILKPLVILSLLISLLAFYFSNVILPIANLKFYSLLYDIKQTKLSFNLKEGTFYNGMDGYVFRIGKKEADGKTIRQVMIYDHTRRLGNTGVTIADSGTMELTPDKDAVVFTLFNGRNYEEQVNRRSYPSRLQQQRTAFREQKQWFDLSGFAMNRSDESLFKDNYDMQNMLQLDQSIDSIKQEINSRFTTYTENLNRTFSNLNKAAPVIKKSPEKDILAGQSKQSRTEIIRIAINYSREMKNSIEFSRNDIESKTHRLRKHEVAFHKKFTLSFACLILFFIGAPLGAIIRKGGLGFPIVISTILFIIYHVISMIGEKYVKSSVMEAHIGMWISSAVLLPVGIFLSYKATTDSPLMDMEYWSRIFNWFSGIRKRKHEHPDPVQ
ncbi:MAG: YjgP/YjgQ family permease [Bacteroidetes bacterium]|nr:YjgP/YjgQ family permease [Bacteroidota bacterium]